MYSSSTVVRGTDQTSASEKALQQQKYEEIVGVLLSAGYFRARVASLTPFDKVWSLHWAVCFHWHIPCALQASLSHCHLRWLVACVGRLHPLALRLMWTSSTTKT
jgi:hypothetical protein